MGAACRTPAPPADVPRTPVLRVGTSGDYPPFALAGQGFDVDLAHRLAADLGFSVQWIPFRWPELRDRVRAGDFDVVMSGVTWRPERAVLGWLSRAVAVGGPCLVGAAAPRRVAVNRGGVLERFARESLAGAEILAVDDNRSLPERYAHGDVDAFVTDSFEAPWIARPEWPRTCAPAVDRTVYWIAPARAADLGPRVDAWLAAREPELRALRTRWMGAPAPRDGVDHLLDLVARRLALMPFVAAWKRARGVPIEDRAREAVVLEAAERAARSSGLEAAPVRALFEVQLDLARRVQARAQAPAEALDLESELRPELGRLGERIVRALADVAPIAPEELPPARTALLEALLGAGEIATLRHALAAVRPAATGPASFRAPTANTGEEPYSAWFGDVDRERGVLYFGLSPFWTLFWQTGGDPTADRALPGDWLIGRFDLAGQRFLPPLRVRSARDGARSSVWDVLAHSNGRVYFTTFLEAFGSVRADGSDVRLWPGLGTGLNEMVEGPDGNLFVTRYADDPLPQGRTGSGAVAVISPEGQLLREFRFPGPAGTYTAPKSLAVDPSTGEIWLNTDTFGPGSAVVHEALRLASDGRVLERTSGPAELHFPVFDSNGRGFFAESVGDRLRVRVRERGQDLATLDLGPRPPLDFVQEVRVSPDGGAILATWRGRAWRVRPRDGGFEVAEIGFELPPECRPPEGRSLLYTAMVHDGAAFATLFCGARVLRAPLPP